MDSTPLLAGEEKLSVGIPINGHSNQVALDVPPGGTHRPVTPCYLNLNNLSYFLGSAPKEVQILHNLSMTFGPGCLTAVMGPSGAGKTTLLNVLISNAGGRVEGEVRVNGRELKQVARRFKDLYTMVPQDDTLLPSLTPFETLTYVAQLRLPQEWSKATKHKEVMRVIDELSLHSCCHTRVGNVDRRGLSGGERKRVSIGCELLVNPSVLFVDEPTSGLDSKTAEDVVSSLRTLAKEGRTLICTIHQPSYKLLQMFDRLVFLSRGRVAYEGAVARVEDYFSKMGYDTPRGENPADYYMRVLQTDDEGEIQKLLTTWENEKGKYAGEASELAQDEASAPDLSKLPSQRPVSRVNQTMVLLRRCFVDALKDKDKFLGGLILKLCVGLLVGIIWNGQSSTFTQESIFPTTGALFVATTSSVLDTLFATVMTFPSSKALLLREYRNGYYSLGPFFISTLTCSIILNASYAAFLGTPIIFLIGLKPSVAQYFLFLAILAVLATTGAALGLLVGSIVKDVQAAQQAVMPTVIPLLMFSGYLIPYKNIPGYFRFLYYISPFAYAFNALQITIYRDVTFTDCTLDILTCPCSPSGCFPTGHDYLTINNTHPEWFSASFGFLMAIFGVIAILGFFSMRYLVNKKTC